MIGRPKTLIETRWEKVGGSYYEQPVNYCAGKELTFEAIRDFNELFGMDYSKVSKESRAYNDSIEQSLFYSHLWKRRKAKNKAFLKILDFNISGKSGSGSSVTPLFPFEIYMMNDGFKMLSFCELNKINPGISILADGMVGDEVINPRGIKYGRCYKKGDVFINLGCGLGLVNFYFSIDGKHFQVDNNYENYESAINGKLTVI